MVVDYVPNAVPAASRDMIDLAEHSPSPAWRADHLCTGNRLSSAAGVLTCFWSRLCGDRWSVPVR